MKTLKISTYVFKLNPHVPRAERAEDYFIWNTGTDTIALNRNKPVLFRIRLDTHSDTVNVYFRIWCSVSFFLWYGIRVVFADHGTHTDRFLSSDRLVFDNFVFKVFYYIDYRYMLFAMAGYWTSDPTSAGQSVHCPMSILSCCYHVILSWLPHDSLPNCELIAHFCHVAIN